MTNDDSNGRPEYRIDPLDTEPRERAADSRILIDEMPASPFPAWDGESAVIYDIEVGDAIELGSGSVPWFSPDSSLAVWVTGRDAFYDGGEVRILDLESHEQTTLGRGRFARFDDENHVLILAEHEDRAERVNVHTGEREPTAVDEEMFLAPFVNVFQPSSRPRTARLAVSYLLVGQPSGSVGATRIYTFQDQEEPSRAADVEALNLVIADSTTLITASLPEGNRTNVFAIDVPSGSTSFLGPGWITSDMFPITADDRFIAWSNHVCPAADEVEIYVYDRAADVLHAIGFGAVPDAYRADLAFVSDFTPSGLLGVGKFGARALIDPETFEVVVALPPGPGDVNWSPDYRFAGVGEFVPHGGRCV